MPVGVVEIGTLAAKRFNVRVRVPVAIICAVLALDIAVLGTVAGVVLVFQRQPEVTGGDLVDGDDVGEENKERGQIHCDGYRAGEPGAGSAKGD